MNEETEEERNVRIAREEREARYQRFQLSNIPNAENKDKPTSDNCVEILSDSKKKLKDLYMEKYSKEPWCREPESSKDSEIKLSFPDEKTADEFLDEAAEKNIKFIRCDPKTGKVNGYSDGSGSFIRVDSEKTSDEILSIRDASGKFDFDQAIADIKSEAGNSMSL
ncbi:MAG: hypothetical protein P1U74_10495 [Legionellaceae bacterium]|nr:hypothetical protein [Legionellaceae bacterium]